MDFSIVSSSGLMNWPSVFVEFRELQPLISNDKTMMGKRYFIK
jgi:hypothetical protein